MEGSAVGRLLSVNVGMPKDVPWHGKTVFTGVFKDPVAGPRRVGKLNVEGDGQGDLGGHGGEQRAVFVYQIESYRYWEQELGRDDFVLRTVRRELHRRGARRRRGLHRRPLPDRRRGLRGHSTPRHLLPRRDPHERPADPGPARIASPARLLLPRHRGGRSGGRRRDLQDRLRPGTDGGRGGGRAALPAGASAPADAASAAHSRTEPRLAGVVPSPARRGAGQRQRGPCRGQPASRLAGLPPAERHRDHARERLGHLDPPRGPGRERAARCTPGPVPHPAGPARPGAAVRAA